MNIPTIRQSENNIRIGALSFPEKLDINTEIKSISGEIKNKSVLLIYQKYTKLELKSPQEVRIF